MSARHPARVVNATEPQYRAFELIARGKPSGAKPETLRALVAHGLLEVVDNRYQVPLAVHVEWSAWNRHLKSERDRFTRGRIARLWAQGMNVPEIASLVGVDGGDVLELIKPRVR